MSLPRPDKSELRAAMRARRRDYAASLDRDTRADITGAVARDRARSRN